MSISHISKEKKNGITGTYVDVHLEHEHHHEHEHEHLHHEHAHHHHHEHRNLFDVNKIIDESEIDEKAKDLAGRFIKNFAKFTGNEAGKALVAAGPKL